VVIFLAFESIRQWGGKKVPEILDSLKKTVHDPLTRDPWGLYGRRLGVGIFFVVVTRSTKGFDEGVIFLKRSL